MAPRSNYDRAVPECLSCGFATGVIPAMMMRESDKAIAGRDAGSRAPFPPRTGRQDAPAPAAGGGARPLTRPFA
jgi:hypothetical protein